MNCYYHPNQPAVGLCKYCQRGLCIACAANVDDNLACKERHEAQVSNMNMMLERNLLQAKRVGSNYLRNAVFYFLSGALFAGFGLYQYRFAGLQALFLIFIGVFLLYAAVANFLESRKY